MTARVYSNDEKNYPTSGLKQIVPTRWTQMVIPERKTFIANSVAEFSEVLADHAKIESMGLGSVVNLPVTFCGDFIGTVNLPHEAGYYSKARAADLPTLILPGLLTFRLSEETANLGRAVGGRLQ